MAFVDRTPLQRRIRSVPTVYLFFVLVTALLPVLVGLALVGDVVRLVAQRKPMVLHRGVLFLWVYLSAEAWAMLRLLVAWLLTGFGTARSRLVEMTYRIQAQFLKLLFQALRVLFRLEVEIEGHEHAAPGKAVYMFHHASMIDTVLPMNLVSIPHGIWLRYVLKDELLVDPAFDIAGNILPNHFVDRSSRRSGTEISKVAALAEDLGDTTGVLIYPEGTRFSEERLRKAVKRITESHPDLAAMAQSFRKVLPPRLGGPLALLDAGADVVICAHAGLSGFGRLKDLLDGGMIGTRIRARFWRVPNSEIPESREDRAAWLFEQWRLVDDWIVAQTS